MIPNLFHSEDFTKIAEALSKALPNIEAATKDKENPHFRSKYADLSSIMDVCKAPLAEAGIIVMQPPASNGDKVSVSTVLMHSSGQWMACNLEMQPVKGDPQGYGSAITYARRYSLSSMLSIPQEDDDGNAASRSPAPKASTPPATFKPAKKTPIADSPAMDFVRKVAIPALEDHEELKVYIERLKDGLDAQNVKNELRAKLYKLGGQPLVDGVMADITVGKMTPAEKVRIMYKAIQDNQPPEGV